MVLFCAAIRRDSVSLLRFPFHSSVQVFLCEISLVCLLKYSYGCFSAYFCFLVVLFALIQPLMLLATVISFRLLYLMLSSSSYIDASILSSMLVSPPPPPSFLDTYSLCHLSNVKPCASSSTYLSSGSFANVLPLSILSMVQSIL